MVKAKYVVENQLEELRKEHRKKEEEKTNMLTAIEEVGIQLKYLRQQEPYRSVEQVIRQLNADTERRNKSDRHDSVKLSDIRSTSSGSGILSAVAPRADMTTEHHIAQIRSADEINRHYMRDGKTFGSPIGDEDPGDHAYMPAYKLAIKKRSELPIERRPPITYNSEVARLMYDIRKKRGRGKCKTYRIKPKIIYEKHRIERIPKKKRSTRKN